MIIPSSPHPQLDLPLTTMNADRHLQEDLLDTPLPNGWHLHELSEGVYYARHPKAGQTGDHDDAEAASKEAHEKHQQWINTRATVGDPAENEPSRRAVTPPEEEAAAENGTNDETDDALVPSQPADASMPTEVLDEDKGEYVTVTPEMRAEAQHAIHRVQGAILITAYWIARIYDDGLYAALGCNSKSQFVERHLPFGTRQAKRYARIGRRLGQFLPDYTKQATNELPSAEDMDGEEMPDSLQGLPMGKLHALTKLDDEDLKDYVETGQWTGPDGQPYTRDDIMEMARAELTETIADRARKFQTIADREKEKRQKAQERALKAEEERKSLQEKLQDEQERIETAKDLERTLGPTASKLEEKRKLHDEAAHHLDEALRIIPKIGVTEDDPEADRQNINRLLQRANNLCDVIREDYAEVLIGASF